MAAFRQHLAFSSLLGVAYSGGVVALGHDWSHAAVAGLLCGASGMLPDLDSPSSRPTREIFAFVSALGPLLILNRFAAAGLSSEVGFLVAAGVYFLLRFGLACFFARFTVHRGMLHSIPAAIIVGQLVYLLHDCADPWGNLILAGGASLGYFSHLLLDELYSVDVQGLRVRLAKSAGSAIKLSSPSLGATLVTWSLLAGLTYLIGVQQGFLDPAILSLPHPRH